MEQFPVQPSSGSGMSAGNVGHGHPSNQFRQEETKLWYENQYLADSGIQSGSHSNSSSVYSHPTGEVSDDMETSSFGVADGRQGFNNQHLGSAHHRSVPLDRNSASSFPAQQNYYPQSPHPQMPPRNPVLQPKIEPFNRMSPAMPRHHQHLQQNTYPTLQRPPSYTHPQSQIPAQQVGMQQQVQPQHPYGAVNPMTHGHLPQQQQQQQQQRPRTVAPVDQSRNQPDSVGSALPNQEIVAHVTELMKMLVDPDQDIVAGANQLLDQMSQNALQVATIAQSPATLAAVFVKMGNITHPATNELICKLLYGVSGSPHGRMGMIQNGGIQFFVQKLRYVAMGFSKLANLPQQFRNYQNINNYIISIFHNLLIPAETVALVKRTITECDGVEALVGLLDSDNVKFLNLVCECLKLLTFKDGNVKDRVFRSNGAGRLLRLFGVSQDEKLLYAVSFVLKNISVEDSNKSSILKNDGLGVLSRCLINCTFSASKVPATILSVFRNMSDMIAQNQNIDCELLLEVVVPFLTKRTEDRKVHPLLIYAAGILSNLTSDAPRNKQKVIELNGIQLLINACNDYPGEGELLETCVCVLRHLITRHTETEKARQCLISSGGLLTLSNILVHRERLDVHGERLDVVKAAVSCLQPLTQDRATHHFLRNQGVFHRLLNLMGQVYLAVKESGFDANASWHLKIGTVSVTVRLADLLSGIIGTLSNFSDESGITDMIHNADLINMIIDLLDRCEQYVVETVLRACVALVSNLAEDRIGALTLAGGGVPHALARLIQRPASGNGSTQELAQQAALTVRKIYEGTPQYPATSNAVDRMMADNGYGLAWHNASATMPHDFLSPMDSYDSRNYHSSGPPSVYGGSIYSSNVSNYEPDNHSGMDMPSYTPNPHLQQQQHVPNNYQHYQNEMNYPAPMQEDPSLQNFQSNVYNQNMHNDGMH